MTHNTMTKQDEPIIDQSADNETADGELDAR